MIRARQDVCCGDVIAGRVLGLCHNVHQKIFSSVVRSVTDILIGFEYQLDNNNIILI